MYDELIKSLRVCGSHDCTSECTFCGKVDGSDCYAELNRRAADAIENLVSSARRWELEAAATKTERDEYLSQNRQLAEAWHNALAMLPRWISVKEQLPGMYETVLVSVASRNGYNEPCTYETLGTMNAAGLCLLYGTSADGERITHWMPLPEPPKEVDDA